MHAFELENRVLGPSEVAQRPPWPDEAALRAVTEELRGLPPLVPADEVMRLKAAMANAARGRAFVLQIGDCAEPMDDDEPRRAEAFLALTRELGGVVEGQLHLPVIHLGRIAGQFAKPRSRPYETIDGRELHAYRGDLVNGCQPTASARVPDCRRLLRGYRSAARTLAALRAGTPFSYCSHEALILEYEVALMRKLPAQDAWFAGSAHLLWIGERTRNPEGAHAAVLAETVNPLAIKVGASADPDEVVALVKRLNPVNEPGRITLITRMGSQEIATALPALVEAIGRAELDVGWVCDPMHGNTTSDPGFGKMRCLGEICREVEQFLRIHRDLGTIAAGLHLEASSLARGECFAEGEVAGAFPQSQLRDRTLCDPRLDSAQARRVVALACQGQ